MPYRLIALALLCLVLLATTLALAAEQTRTLAVRNMVCATCPYIVEQSLLAVDGVRRVAVSLKRGTATVSYDDTRVQPGMLSTATTNAGFPSIVQDTATAAE